MQALISKTIHHERDMPPEIQGFGDTIVELWGPGHASLEADVKRERERADALERALLRSCTDPISDDTIITAKQVPVVLGLSIDRFRKLIAKNPPPFVPTSGEINHRKGYRQHKVYRVGDLRRWLAEMTVEVV